MVGACDVLNGVDEVIGCCCGAKGWRSVSRGKRTKEFRGSRHSERGDISFFFEVPMRIL
jgi:hypothetical protein